MVGTQSAEAYTLGVKIVATSEPRIVVGGQIQFLAAVAGGSGNFSYSWYSNGTAIVENATSSTLTFNATTAGSFNITCVAADATGTADPGTSNAVILTVLQSPPEKTPVAQGAQPSASPTDNENANITGSKNLELPIQAIVVAAIVVVAVVGVIVGMVLRQRSSKRMNKP